jgi:hypothetical protein
MSKKGELILDFIYRRANDLDDLDAQYMLDILYDNNLRAFNRLNSYNRDVDWEVAEYRSQM